MKPSGTFFLIFFRTSLVKHTFFYVVKNIVSYDTMQKDTSVFIMFLELTERFPKVSKIDVTPTDPTRGPGRRVQGYGNRAGCLSVTF